MKKLIALSSIAFLSTVTFADADMQKQIDTLTQKITQLEKANKKQDKKISEVNAQSAKDNIKFDVDFRTAYDNISYKTANGKKYGTANGLLSNRLWLGMGYAPTTEMLFKGQLSYNKAYGATASNMANGNPQRGYGYDAFDWISNESLADDKLRVREAYWLWTPKTDDLGFTVSVGRRPSTNGYLANLREDDAEPKSPLGHVINMEFDGASAGIQLDKYVPGMLFKLCLGRGLTNANAKFTNTPTYANIDYAKDYTTDANGNSNLNTIDLAGFIFVPYDNGQYAVKTTWYRGFNVPGMYGTSLTDMDSNPATQYDLMPTAFTMLNGGDMDGMAISGKIDGIGNEISDFLDATTLFASYARSVSHPNQDIMRTATAADASWSGTQNTGATMLGSADSQTGSSVWLGTQMPNLMGGKFGLEYNQGSKYWRPFTYGEDTMMGSKMAVRGKAYDAYISQPLIKDVFSMQVRYTYINYEYTGSNAFFGDGGTPYSMAEAKAMGMDPVETASDLRVYFRYRY
jgi:hypothetical protein